MNEPMPPLPDPLPDHSDYRYTELHRLGETERHLAAELVGTRAAIARLVTELLPQHAPRTRIEEVVSTSGYSRTLIEALRGGHHPWVRR
ncbi:hypothetical protein [Amycolatopsis magusensis]|uniref:Uncharacterized protein n=1 Tax=Amycolatopsis magusensis TaxID=882444 RepID=A0ABS4PZ12_9PSEU|nr:hypothetical protein [Amycolatopsis magusensis]MBP2184089.1 hypothetical protein [Amycolatopsis magusensis]MDI5975856.1 hypothetical protein [Amycolatopsis magusensis]